MGNSIKKQLILSEIAKTNNKMMSSVLSNNLGWPGRNSSKQVRLIHMHTWRHDYVATDLGKCTHLYDEAQGNKETQALSTETFLRQVQEDR